MRSDSTAAAVAAASFSAVKRRWRSRFTCSHRQYRRLAPLPVVHYYSAVFDIWACGRGGGALFALQSASPQRVFPCRSSITCRQAGVHAFACSSLLLCRH